MNIQKKRDFLTNFAYWAIIIGAVYLVFEYIVPISVPFIFGILIAWLVVWISRKIHCTHRLLRLCLTFLIYGILGLILVLLCAKGISAVTDVVKWLPELYENKLQPFVQLIYTWCIEHFQMLDPNLVTALEMLLESALSALKNLISFLSGAAVDLVSGIATGIPNLILSLLAMIFSTVFLVVDYEHIADFVQGHIPAGAKNVLTNVRTYLTDTLFVVVRSYVLIMLLTFVELSILFSLFGISNAVVKAGLIAMLDVLPILGTGGIMIPWAVISLVLGHVRLGLELLLIYAIVTVVRNYVEPKIVGAQLGLHPIITLVSMFIGLRLFGFWGLFGLPVGISYFWKQRHTPQ
nr:AI-2E family transporter [Oscillospiraceae bacterium]